MSQANVFMNQDACPCGNETVREQAAQWFSRTRGGALTADQQAQLDAWLAQFAVRFDAQGGLILGVCVSLLAG